MSATSSIEKTTESAEVRPFKQREREEETARRTGPANDRIVEDVPAAEQAGKKRRPVRRIVLGIIGLAVLAGAGWYGHGWWTEGRFMVSTDDAYVEGNITTIAPKVTGYVAKVNVTENEHVKAGDPLVTLDDGDYRIAADQAHTALANQKLTLDRIDAQITGAEASLAQANAQRAAAQAARDNASSSQRRADKLHQSDFASTAALDSANTALAQAEASLQSATAGVSAAEANIGVLKAQKAEAEGALKSLELAADKADRDLSFTVLRAPYDGVVGNVAAHTGDLVSAGQRLAALVPVSDLYVEANFKETQLAGIEPGEKVKIAVDAWDSDPVEGTVVSIAPASGSVFSLLPANNATGNFTKVVQRVPVRIAFPQEALDSGKLRAGLSVVVDIDSRTAPVHGGAKSLAMNE